MVYELEDFSAEALLSPPLRGNKHGQTCRVTGKLQIDASGASVSENPTDGVL
jgi:hypothetical protein